jgi:NADPH:quinone reductase-like Zn-dependent oxidoreductase
LIQDEKYRDFMSLFKNEKSHIQSVFGISDVLEITETDMPTIYPQDILVHVKAVSINPVDWKIFHGAVKMLSGKRFPKSIGLDFSGTIVETEKRVGEFQVDDDMFGGVKKTFKEGALAEYVVATSSQLALKPHNISHQQAAAMTSVGAPMIIAFEDNTASKTSGSYDSRGFWRCWDDRCPDYEKARAIVTSVSSTKGLPYTKAWGQML